MNINVWLQTVKEHLNKSSISTDEQKQKCTMQFLDAQSQRILQAKIDEGKIKTYTDLETYLRAFFSNGDRSSLGDLVKLISRKQQPNESLAKFYEDIKHLTNEAYPNEQPDITEKYAMDYFIKGLYDDKLKTALALQTTPPNANKLLADAVEVQTKLVTIADTNQPTIAALIQATQQNHQTVSNMQYMNNSSTYNLQPQRQSPNYHHTSNNHQSPTTTAPYNQHQRQNNCYVCNQPNHIARHCPSNNRSYNSSNQPPNLTAHTNSKQ
jgi:hypothetical protein